MRPGNARAVIAVLGLCLLAGLAGTAWAQIRLPPPGGRSVYDLAGVLEPVHVRTMEQIHRELLQKTGVAVVVVTVPRLDDEPIGDFAVRVGSEWGVGRKGEDRGVVIALAIEERKVFIATGYGVEGFLPDGRVGGILDRYAIPHLRRNEYSAGILKTSLAVVAAAAQEYGVTIEGAAEPVAAARGRPRPTLLGGILSLVFLVGMAYLFVRHPSLFFLLLLSGMGRGGGYRGGFGGGGFGGGSGFGGFGGGGFGGGGAGRGF